MSGNVLFRSPIPTKAGNGLSGFNRYGQTCLLPEISLIDWIRYCCTGELPAVVCDALARGGFLADLIRYNALTGDLQPKCVERPGACDPVAVVDKEITVPAATLNPDGSVTPSEVRAISYCAPLNRALVVAESRITAGNAIASTQPVTQPIFKRVNLATFPDGFCLPFEPADMPGQFSNVENVIVPPQAGYSIFVQNFSTAGAAVYNLHSRMWACC